MNDLLNLASLEPDIITRIIREADDSLEDLRFISHSWNDRVSEYLTQNRLGALERVYVYSSVARDDDDDKKMSLGLYRNKYAEMVMILPARHSKNIGVGSWLRVLESHTDDCIEVACSAQRSEGIKASATTEGKPIEVKTGSEDEEPELVDTTAALLNQNEMPPPGIDNTSNDVILSMKITTLVTAFIISFHLIGLNLLGLIIMLSIFYHSWSVGVGELSERKTRKIPKKDTRKNTNTDKQVALRQAAAYDHVNAWRYAALKKNEKREERHFPQLARFISMFSSIESLVLEKNSEMLHGADGFINTLDKTLGGIKINRLEIREYILNDILQNDIVELCRRHEIHHVFVAALYFRMNDFQVFAKELAAIGTAIDLYELGQTLGGRLHFGKQKLFWDTMARELEQQNVSLRLSSFDNAAFHNGGYSNRVRAHLRCESALETITDPLKAIEIKRGFNLRTFF